MNWHSQYGQSSVFTPDAVARKGLDTMHNTEPLITCEGKCSKTEVRWTPHSFIREYKTGHHTFRQDYSCDTCGEIRQFGLTEIRITLKGESN